MMKFFTIAELKKILQSYNPPTYVIKQQRNEEGIDERVVSYADKNSYIAEQYKVLRTNLYSLSPEKQIKTIVITSSQPQEGKSITSSNLAITLSLDTEKRILLIDADLRKPAIHTLFGIERKPGLVDVVNNEVDIETFIKKTTVGNLHIMPSGARKSNPSEILSSTKIRNIIDKLKMNFDYIIFDTPPVLNVTDASILGSLCDAVILVVRAGVTQKTTLEEAFSMLEGAQARPKACILTGVLLDTYYYFYNRYRYYKYSDKGEKKEAS